MNCVKYHTNFLDIFFMNYTKGVDIIGRQETLKQDLSRILAKYKIKHIHKINVHSKYKLKIKNKTLELFMNKYNKLLDQYNYNYIPKNIEIL